MPLGTSLVKVVSSAPSASQLEEGTAAETGHVLLKGLSSGVSTIRRSRRTPPRSATNQRIFMKKKLIMSYCIDLLGYTISYHDVLHSAGSPGLEAAISCCIQPCGVAMQ